MPISATERSAVVLREVSRRLAHQVSNAANAAAVNVEVLRSRLSRGGASAESLTTFAERAAAAAEQMSAGVTAMRALLHALSEAAGEDGAEIRAVRGDPQAVEITWGSAAALDAAAIRFAETAGVALSSTPTGVILRVLRRGAADNDATE